MRWGVNTADAPCTSTNIISDEEFEVQGFDDYDYSDFLDEDIEGEENLPNSISEVAENSIDEEFRTSRQMKLDTDGNLEISRKSRHMKVEPDPVKTPVKYSYKIIKIEDGLA